MSLNCLEDPYREPKVADELEGFLHSLLYHSLRFLRHNVDPIFPFVESYFDEQKVQGDRLTPPLHKRACIEKGCLVTLNAEPLVFKRPDGSPHALNVIFEKLFKAFQARYIVLTYKRKLGVLENQLKAQVRRETATDNPGRSSPTPYRPSDLWDARWNTEDVDEDEDEDEDEEPERKRRDIRRGDMVHRSVEKDGDVQEVVVEEKSATVKRSDQIRAQINMLQQPTED